MLNPLQLNICLGDEGIPQRLVARIYYALFENVSEWFLLVLQKTSQFVLSWTTSHRST